MFTSGSLLYCVTTTSIFFQELFFFDVPFLRHRNCQTVVMENTPQEATSPSEKFWKIPDRETIELRQKWLFGKALSQPNHPYSVDCHGTCPHKTSPRYDPELRPPNKFRGRRYPPVQNPTFIAKTDCRRPNPCHCCGVPTCSESKRCNKFCYPRSRLSKYCDDCLGTCAWDHFLQDYRSFWSSCMKTGEPEMKYDSNL